MWCQQHHRFLWCLLLVGTTAWIPPSVVRIRRVSNYKSNTGSVFFHHVQNQKHCLAPWRLFDASHDDKGDHKHRPSRGRRALSRLSHWRKRVFTKKSFMTTVLALTLSFKTPGETASAIPKPEQQMYSLRPGVSAEQAASQAEGREDAKMNPEGDIMMDFGAQEREANTDAAAESKKSKKEKKKKQKETFDYGEDEDDFEETEYEMVNQQQPKSIVTGGSSAAPGAASANSMPAAMAPTSSTNMGMAKMKAIGVFVFPIVGFITGRGLLQERRNQKILKKAIDIMDAQKAEYFNVTTSSNVTDVEIEDALKGMKNETATDDDDDEEDDGDEEDDTPPPPRRKPRGGGGGDDSGGDNGGGADSGGPSQDDLDRLKNLFNKS